MSIDTSLSRRRAVSGLLALAALPALPLRAQVAFPYYRGEDALQGLYAQHMPALARAFETQARALTAAVRGQCGKAEPAALLQAWRQTLQAWLALVAEGIDAEATALRAAFDQLATRNWSGDEEGARTAFAEWINQWLGGLERLRWIEIEKPVQRARTAGQGRPPAFARRSMNDNLAAWRTQWQALRAQARLSTGQQNTPPQPGRDLVPIEALLMGKGQIALAQRWAQAIGSVDHALAALPAQPDEDDLMSLSTTMKQLTALYQHDIASALDVPLGFSDADGD